MNFNNRYQAEPRNDGNELVRKYSVVVVVLGALLSQTSLRSQDIDKIGAAKPFTLQGSLNLQGNHFASSFGNSTGRPSASATLFLSAAVGVYGIQFPFSAHLTTSETTFRQPFNEFGVSPTYKWITGHFGYRSVNYSQFTLSGQRWLGAGIDFKNDWLRASTMYGRFQAATEADTSHRAPAIFKRMGYALKLGVGSENNSIDLNFFKGWDDSSSVKTVAPELMPLPAENVAIALSSRFGIIDQMLSMEFEIAGSAYTRDLGSSDENVNELPGFIASLVPIKSSTRANYAIKGALNFSRQSLRVSLRYERVEPDFQSMGVGYISGDHEDITIAPSVSLLSQLRLNASIGLRRNNLLNDRLTTTKRFILSFGGMWQASDRLGIDARYSNFSASSSDGRVRVTDTTRIENISQTISLGPRYTFGEPGAQHSISFQTLVQNYDDRNLISGSLSNNNSSTYSLNYSGNVSEITLNGSATYMRARAATYHTTTISGNAGASKALFENTFYVSVNLSLSRVESDVPSDIQILPAFTLSYRLSEKDNFTLTSQLSHRAGNGQPSTEIHTNAGYSRSF